MGRKKKRLLLARINNKAVEEVSVTSEVVKEEPEPVVAEVVAEVEVEVPSVITEAPEAVKPPEKLVKTPRKK